MARGLSRLQEAILLYALKNERTVTADDVLADYYGLMRFRSLPLEERRERRKTGKRMPSILSTGEDYYNNKYRAAVSRSFKRLEKRKLLINFGLKRGLTEKGREVAEKLMVNKPIY